MKLTNRLGLPDPFVEAVRRDLYDKGEADFSVTELLRPPRINELERQLGDKVEEDVADHIYRLLGQAMAVVLERGGVPERRFVMEIEVDGKIYSVSGKPDRFVPREGLLQDWKLTTIYKTKDGALPEEFAQQLNIYAELMRANRYEVKRAEAVIVYRDWSKVRASFKKKDYPLDQAGMFSAILWPREEVLEFIKDRIRLQLAARKKLPLCTDPERWAKGEQFAVMKKGRKTAVRVLNNEIAAKTFIQAQKLDPRVHYIERRPAEVGQRCKFYCSVRKFCQQRKAMMKKSEPAKVTPIRQPAPAQEPKPKAERCPVCGSELVEGRYGHYCRTCYIKRMEARKATGAQPR